MSVFFILSHFKNIRLLVVFLAVLIAFDSSPLYASGKEDGDLSGYELPFPDEEFSFNKFGDHRKFYTYLRARLPVGTTEPEVDQLLVGYGDAEKNIIVIPQRSSNGERSAEYIKKGWANYVTALFGMQPFAAWRVITTYDRNGKLTHLFLNGP